MTFVPQGGQAPYTFSLSGNLPTGWTYGNISRVASLTAEGTSSDLGGGTVLITVTDSINQSYTTTVNWTVTQPAQIQADFTNIDPTSLAYVRNKPTKYYLGSTELNWPGTSSLTPVPLTGIASIDGNAATVTDGVYTTGTYDDPDWINTLAGSKITGSAPLANALTTTRYLNGSAFNGSQNVVISRILGSSALIDSGGNITATSSLDLSNTGTLTFNASSGGIINGAYGISGNGMLLSTGTAHPDGPGDLRLLCSYNGQYNQITVNRGGIGIQSATSDGSGGGTSPFSSFTLTPSGITVNGTITMGGLVQFTGGTSGLSKASVGLGNVDNVSNSTLLNNTTFTGTTNIPIANITTTTGTITAATITTATLTTANITQGTLTTNGTTATSLVNKQYVDSKIWLALAVGF